MPLAGKAGTTSQPIVVVGPEDQSAVFTARDCCNTVQLDGTSYVQIVNLTLDGDGRIGPAGVNSLGDSHHITLENLEVIGYGGSPGMADGEGSVVARDNLFVNAVGEVVSVGRAETASKFMQVAAVSAAATPIVTLSASPGSVPVGGTSVLSWTSTDAAGCSASGGWSGTKGPTGSETVGPLQAAASFQLTCLGTGGNANAITQITVGGGSSPPGNPPPTTPPPSTPPPMDTGQAKSGGGGGLDAMVIVFLALIAGLRLRRSAGAQFTASDIGRNGVTGAPEPV